MASRSALACWRWRILFGMRLGYQPLPATLLDVVDIEILGRPTIKADLDGLAECIHLGGAEMFAFLHQAQSIPHDLAGGAVPAAFDQPLDEFFEVSAECVAGRHVA